LTGRIVSHYELQSLLGEGAMGRVFRAHDVILERYVALKLVNATSPTDPAFMDRFLREARLAAQLNHPHVATIYEFGSDQGEAFLVMELVEGQTLAEAFRVGPRGIAEVRRWGAQAASALAAAHAAGIVHRDIKPGNLMLTRTGSLKVMDFGIARRAGDVGLTREGAIIGTPKTMAPEILHGQQPSPPSDLFSLGCVLYEGLAGQPPFTADDTMAVLFQIAQQDPPPIESLRPEVPADLAQIINGLLVKDPARRFGPAGAVAAALSGETWMPPETHAASGSDETVALSASEVSRSVNVTGLSRSGIATSGATPATTLAPQSAAMLAPPAAATPVPPPAPRHRRSAASLLWVVVAVVSAGGGMWYALGSKSRVTPGERRTRAERQVVRGVEVAEWIREQGFANAPAESIKVAERWFKKAARTDESYPVPHNNLGDLYFHTKRYNEAEAAFHAALHDDINYAPAYAGLGQLYEAKGDTVLAIEQYKSAMDRDSSLVVAPNNLAHLLTARKQPQAALAVLQPALELYPESAALWRNVGLALRALGEIDDAESALSHSLQIDPEQPEVVAARAEVAREKARILEERKSLGLGPESVPGPGGTLPHPPHPPSSPPPAANLPHP
jgi:serine/threonine protein kinase/Tfp pilus assembly protein PilF